jgi:hypothetical protein
MDSSLLSAAKASIAIVGMNVTAIGFGGVRQIVHRKSMWHYGD